MWPNPEVLLFSMFSSALMLCASSVLGATISGYAITPGNLAVAIVTLVAVVTFYVYELCRILSFLRHHEAACWNESEPPANKARSLGSNQIVQLASSIVDALLMQRLTATGGN